jgi:hypothetical protein
VSYQAPPGQHCSDNFAGLAGANGKVIPCDPVPDAAAPSAEPVVQPPQVERASAPEPAPIQPWKAIAACFARLGVDIDHPPANMGADDKRAVYCRKNWRREMVLPAPAQPTTAAMEGWLKELKAGTAAPQGERTSDDGPYKKALEELLKTPPLTQLGN